MKKLSLKSINLSEIEQLSREQLKNVMGGFIGSTETTSPPLQSCDCGEEKGYVIGLASESCETICDGYKED